MAILKVARMGHPVLRARAHPVDPGAVGSQVIQKLIDDMIETMNEYQGIGLAAPQVHESLRLFVAGIEGEEDRLPPMVLVNPEVLPQGRRDQAAVIGGVPDGGVAVACRIDDLPVEVDSELDTGRREGAVPARHDAHEQEREEAEGEHHGHDAIDAKAALGRMAPAQATARAASVPR